MTALGEDIRNCLKVIGDWMNEYFLCLNQTKTKILIVAPPSIKEKDNHWWGTSWGQLHTLCRINEKLGSGDRQHAEL